MNNQFDVAIIGAGPSGAVASALLNKQGFKVCVLEKQHFPRFVIGESLLPHCMEMMAEAGLLEAVQAEPSFQFKNGAAFTWGARYTYFDFTDKFSPGPGTTFQVRRAAFDKILIDEAAKQGVEVRFGHGVTEFDNSGEHARLQVAPDNGTAYELTARFVLDASGYGRVLPRLLDLEAPSNFPVRQAVFTHIEDRIEHPGFDRTKILVTTHPTQRDIWFWTIPFSNGRCSVGVVAAKEHFDGRDGDLDACLRGFIEETPSLSSVLQNAVWDTPARTIGGYAANVKTLHGPGFALLGNAAEFLDPVFSSGVTIAMRSASMAAGVLHRQLKGETVDWESEFAAPLKRGVDTFRCYVEGWYAGTFQDVIFHPDSSPDIRRMICSILAGYAWDERNPFVSEPKRRLRMLSEICASEPV